MMSPYVYFAVIPRLDRGMTIKEGITHQSISHPHHGRGNIYIRELGVLSISNVQSFIDVSKNLS